MNLIKIAIDRPTAVVAAVIMAILFGLAALQSIPIQLAPDVARPVIEVRTTWLGAAPAGAVGAKAKGAHGAPENRGCYRVLGARKKNSGPNRAVVFTKACC